ncbi:porin OmpA [Seminibacterium arietis]|uniref:Outer membrane protein A n=1 Tax=Seminibacterium arietis TaxID=1173502 RepID=A0ABW3I5Y0_9PAST
MKKTAIALAIAGLAAASVAQAAPLADTFYVGAKAGRATFHDGVKISEPNGGVIRSSVTYGVYGGYQITDNFAVELGYDYFGRAKDREYGKTVGKHTNHGVHLGLKASYPVLDGLDVYARAAAALIRTDLKEYSEDGERTHSLKVSPVFAGGIEYNLPSLPELALRVEYQWVENVGKLKDKDGSVVDLRPDIGSINAGLSYRFGQTRAVEPMVVDKTFALSSDILFKFNKASLKEGGKGQEILDGIYGEIAQLKAAQVNVAGYADRIGSDAYNQKLSQKRAETVANYLVAKGVAQNVISAAGYGEANPVTGNKCDAVKGRKALIACLADDRRVEVSVKGTK